MDTAGPRILIVDDDAEMLETFRRVLRDSNPLIAGGGLMAKQILSATAIDVVVCDLDMPGMGGLDLMSWAKTECPHPIWIVVTGQRAQEAAIQALKLGAYDFICKPLQSSLQLQTAVANAARHRALLGEFVELHQLVENLPELAWSARADGQIEFFNRRWYEYAGLTFEEMEGSRWRSLCLPSMLDAVDAAWRRSLRTGEPFEMEFPLRGADGLFRWFLSRMRPLRDGGIVTRWLGTSVDIDVARQARAEREVLVAELRNAIALRDEFLSIASHEFRTPLNVLQLQLEVTSELVRRLDGPQPVKAVARLEVASRQVQHLTSLVEGLLDFSHSNLGQPTLSRHELELVAMVQRVIARHQQQAAAAGCSLQLVAGHAVTGEWDGPRLEQVFTNLITNSLSFGAGHPIEVTISGADDSARIAVRDHGIGIPPADLGRVFAKFERAVSSKHFGGLGLGLYVARQIVEAHGGTIDVASTVGEGATFAVNLPCHLTARATA